jgi:hypothetical protein
MCTNALLGSLSDFFFLKTTTTWSQSDGYTFLLLYAVSSLRVRSGKDPFNAEKQQTWSQLDRWVRPSFVICGPLGPDRERSHLTPKNNYMVLVRWVHRSLTIYGLLGPDQERSHLTPKKQHGPSPMVTPLFCYIGSLRARSRKKPFHTKFTPLSLDILGFCFKWSGQRDPLEGWVCPPSNYNCEKELWVRTKKLKFLDRANQHQPLILCKMDGVWIGNTFSLCLCPLPNHNG